MDSLLKKRCTSPQSLKSGCNFIYASYMLCHFYLPCFCLVFSSILISAFELEPDGIFSSCSWHVSRLGPNIFILSQSDKHPFSVLLRVYKFSFHHVAPSNVKPCNGLTFRTYGLCILLTTIFQE